MTQPFDPTARSAADARPGRPLWMLALLALGFGPLLARLLLDGQLAGFTTYLVNSLGLAEDRSSIHLVRLLVRFLLPACALLAVLRFTSLRRWFAFTPLTLFCLFVGDVLVVLNLVDQLRLYVLSGYPSFRFTGEIAAAIAILALSLAAISLALATTWYRSNASRQWICRHGRRWWREA